jgi:presenilin-like A22 family membrane protease
LRLVSIKKGIAKYTTRPMISFSPQSVEERLKAAFYQPLASSYPDMLTVFQQSKADESALLGMCD